MLAVRADDDNDEREGAYRAGVRRARAFCRVEGRACGAR